MIERQLYCPSKMVSYEAQVERAQKILRQPNNYETSIGVHRHPIGATCVATSNPDGLDGCIRLRVPDEELTGDGPAVIVEDISKTDSNTVAEFDLLESNTPYN